MLNVVWWVLNGGCCVVGVEWWVLNGGHNGECCTVCGGC